MYMQNNLGLTPITLISITFNSLNAVKKQNERKEICNTVHKGEVKFKEIWLKKLSTPHICLFLLHIQKRI